MLEWIRETQDVWQRLQNTQKPIVMYGMGDGAVKILVDGNLPRPEADGRHLDVVGEHGRFGKRLSRCH